MKHFSEIVCLLVLFSCASEPIQIKGVWKTIELKDDTCTYSEVWIHDSLVETFDGSLNILSSYYKHENNKLTLYLDKDVIHDVYSIAILNDSTVRLGSQTRTAILEKIPEADFTYRRILALENPSTRDWNQLYNAFTERKKEFKQKACN